MMTIYENRNVFSDFRIENVLSLVFIVHLLVFLGGQEFDCRFFSVILSLLWHLFFCIPVRIFQSCSFLLLSG